MASNFLKNMAQQQAEKVDREYGADAYGSSSWREKQSSTTTQRAAGAQTSTASSFLRSQAQKARERVDAQYGADAYGGSNFRFNRPSQQTSAVTPSVTTPTTTTKRKTTAGGFYSMPDFGTESQRLESAARTAKKNVQDKETELEGAYRAMSELEKSAQFYGQQAQSIYDTYLKSQDPAWGSLFERASANYEKASQEYNAAASSFNALYAEYEPLLNTYNQAAEAYNQYVTGQQAAYGEWKGTIRTQDVIQQDIDSTDAAIEQLQEQKNQLTRNNQALTAGISRARLYGPVDTLETQLTQNQEQADAIDAQIQDLADTKTLLEEELEWAQYFQYADLTQAADFTELSQYRSTANGKEPEFNAWSGMYTETGFNDIEYDIINRNEEAMSHQMVNDVQTNASFLGLDNSERREMTDEEIAIFNYLYAQDTARGDAEHTTAYAYIDYLTSDLNYRKRQADEEEWASYAKEHPVGSSVFSVITSPLKGLSYIGQAADYLEDREIDQNAGYNRFSYINSAIRDEVGTIVEDKWGGVGSFAYDTGMSMADFLFNAAVSGGNQGVALAIMGTGAAADATIDAKDRGLSDDQAFALGTIAGAAEIITEKFSLDALFKGNWDKGAVKYILQNAFTEGSEEVASDTINLFADILIAKDKSEWQTAIDAYMEQGKSEREAFGLALADQAAQMGLDFLGGALSGGIMSSVNVGVNRVTGALDNRRQQNQEAAQQQAETMEQADNMAEEYLQREVQEQEGVMLPTAEEMERQQAGQALGQDTQVENAQDAGVLPTTETAQQQAGTAVQTEAETGAEPGMLPTAEQAELQQRMERATTDLERSGIQAGVQEETIQTAQRLSDALGRNIRFYDGNTRQDASSGANGYYVRGEDTIYVNSRSRNPVAQIISHELTHSVELADAYKDLSDLVLNRIQQTGGNLEQLRREKAELYARRGAQLGSQEEIDQEIVAQYVERYLLTDEQSIRELTRQNRSLGQRILSWLNELLAKLGNESAQERAFITQTRDTYARALQETQTSFTSQTAQAAPAARQNTQQTTGPPVMQGGETDLEQGQQTRPAEDTRRAAPEAAQEAQEAQRRRGEAQEALAGLREDFAAGRITEEEFDAAIDAIMEEEGLAGEEMLEQYSIDENYERDIDDWDEAGRPDGEVFILGATGDVLQGLGAMEQDIYLRSEKVNTILQQHPEMTLAEIKRIPEILDDPVLVLKSRNAGRGGQQNTRLVLFGTVRAENGQPVLAVLDLRPVENGLAIDDMQKVTSSYTKDNNAVWYVQNSDILHADKNRTIPLLRTIGFQMPIELQRSGSMGSISYRRQNVNIQGVPFDQVVDTTGQQDGDGRRYSFGGRNANRADLDALNHAQEMERQGVSMDTIFRETGWYTGADGKWRFEIDDSGMEYSRWGDLRREDRAEYARFRELEGKFIDGSITMDEQNELRQLLEEGHGAGRAEEQQTLRLPDFVRHDELYQNYPQLRQAGLRFTRLPEGTRGTFDGQDIVLDESLRSAPEDTLVHEIQHAIQRAEGFTGGASPESWQAVRQQVIDTVAGARQNLDLWLQDIGYPEFVRESMNRVVSGEITLDEHWKALEEFKRDSPFAAEIARCEEELAAYENQLRTLNNLGDGEWANSFDMYENTAGEIEARDVTQRRQMTPEQRRQTMPNTGDERTVYAEAMQELGSKYGMWDSLPEKRQFSMSEPVEQTRDLLALHNLTEDKLRSTLQLGGFPMPSIAVIRDQMQHDNYGDITMVFSKDTIDPQADSRNRVYGGDAWTPTAPRVDYPIDYQVQRAFEDLVEQRSANVAGGTFSRGGVMGSMGITGDSTYLDMDEITQKLAGDYAVQAAYLAEQGQNVEPVMKAKQFDSYGNDTLRKYAESMDIQELAGIAARIEAGETMTDEEIKAAKEFIRQAMLARGGFNTSPQRIEMRLNKVTDERVERFAQHAWEYLQDGGATTDEVDYYATRDALEDAVDKRAVADWARQQLEGLLGEPGIYNGKDPYTPAGNSRSFAQLHYPYTLENLVRAMSTTQEARGEGLWGATAKGLQSVSTPEYRSVEEIHADEGRLQNLSQEEYDALLQDVDNGIEEVIEEVRSTNKAHSDNRFEEADIIGSVMIDAARGKHTAAAVTNTFHKEGYTISRELAEKIVGLYDQAASVPTGYFEAKPQRAVPLDEILAAVVPDTMDAELRGELERAGVPTLTYPEGDTKRRMEAVNSVEGAKFSISEDDADALLADTDDGSGPYDLSRAALRNDTTLQQRISRAREMTKTEAFREWFGNSKVRNVSGGPLLVFHGAGDRFTVFNSGGRPMWFTSNAAYAEQYASDMGTVERVLPASRIYTGGNRLVPAYLGAETPAEVGNVNEPYQALEEELAQRTGIPVEEWRTAWEEAGRPELAWQVINTPGAARLLQLYGYDGIVANEGTTRTYAVFDADQVKSAVANRGTFSRENPDIRYSIDEGNRQTPERRQEILSQLRRYVNGDMTTTQLRRYLDGVDGGNQNTDTSAAQEIVDNAHREGLSVEEYLRQNWELYEYDGSWNEDARQAMELERAQSRRRYSIEDNERVFMTPRGVEVVQNPTDQEYRQMRDEVYQDYPWLRGTGEPVLRHTYDRKGNEYYWRADQAIHAQVEPYINEHYGTQTSQQWQWWTREDADEWPTDYTRQYSVEEEAQLPTAAEEEQRDIISTMPVKAQQYLRRAERYLLDKVSGLLNVPRFAQREYLQDIVREISMEYLRDGRVSDETIDELFDRAYDEGVVYDREFYDQYEDLRKYLRTTRLTISPEDSADIADFNDFRKSNFGRLHISTQGGTNIDRVYLEMAELWPEFFNEQRESHPADQLQHIAEVAQSFQVIEKNLDEYYGPEAEEFRRWARHDFEAAVNDTLSELRSVRRYTEDRAAQADVEAPPTTQAEVTEMWGQLKQARRSYEKVMARNLLTQHDEVQLGRLMRGEIELEHLDQAKDNVKGITAVYEAKQEYERLTRLIRQWNQSRKAALRQQADRYLQTANDWKDKRAGILYSRETMERNIRDIVKDETLAEEINQTYFKPVHDASAAANRMKNQYRDRVRELKLSRKVEKGNTVSEAHAVQLLGEAEDNIRVLEQSRGRLKARDGKSLEDWRGIVNDLWAENPNLDADKIRAAVAQFRSIYDELFQQMNEARVRNGYEPVNYRSGYFPHFQPGNGDGILSQFGKALGIDTEVTALPTTINGLTHTFRPGIRWFGNAQQRLGFNTAYDAVEGFDRYIEGVADVIHQTDNIQRLRALANQIRYRTGDEGIRKQVDAVMADPNLSEQDKQNRIEKIYETGRYALSNFVVELEEYTNLLANKKSRADRNMEQALGRGMYNLVKALESRVAANMVAVNPASWLTNFIPLTQGGALLDRGMLLKGMWDTLKAYKVDDGIVDKSSFLTNRRGSDPIVRTWAQQASATASKPMEYIDQFVADSLVRARYRQNLGKNMSEDAAMSEADAWVAGVMADRSKGSTPTLFNRSNPLTKVFTQFQLEVNNQLSYLFKDMPRDTRDKGIAALAAALLKFFLGAWLFDEVYEYVIGRRPALDPIGILNDTVGDLTGWELPNLVELGVGAVSGNIPSFQVEQTGLSEAGANLAGTVAETLPFIGGVLGGGRVPISSAIPNLGNLWNALTNEDWSAEKRLQEVRDELLEKPLVYLGLPFGGGQLKKIYEGIEGVIQGGSYSVNAEGEQELQYPIYNDTTGQAIGNSLLAAVFGRTSLPTGRDWIESGFDTLGVKQTAVYQGLLEAGVPGKEAYDLLKQLQGAEKTETESEATRERKLLEDADISGDGKSVVYYGLMASDRERELMDSLADEDADMGEVTTALMGIKDAGALKGAAASNAKRDAIAGAALSEDEQIQLYNYTFGEKQEDGSYLSSRADDIAAFQAAGMSFDQFLEAQNEYSTINEEYDSSSEKAVEFARWVNNQGLTEEQAAVVKDAFTYYSQIPQSGGYYEKFTAVGLDDQSAYDLNEALGNLEPTEGEDQVTSLQKYQAVVNSGLTESEQMTAMGELMPEGEYEKLRAVSLEGVTPRAYVSYKQTLPLYDTDGNGSFKQEEVEAALDSLPLTTEQRAALWQMQNKSWKPGNNPYSVSVSQQVYNTLNAEEEDDGLMDWSGGITLPTAEEAEQSGLMNWN